MTLAAVEFFSGIGAFAQAAKAHGGIEIVQAFDQNASANASYELNYGLKPDHHNLDSIKASQIKDAQLWWMSPPCTPYSVRGNRLDTDDPRARSFLNLLSLLPVKKPELVLIENVVGFKDSRMHAHISSTVGRLGYTLSAIELCPSIFGVPMLRPRLFFAASKNPIELFAPPLTHDRSTLTDFLLDLDSEARASLMLDMMQLERYRPVLNIVDASQKDARAICFTSGYYKCRKASGSLIDTGDGARFFAPREILNLLGFGADYQLPPDLPLPTLYRLVGNSVDVRSIRHLLAQVIGS